MGQEESYACSVDNVPIDCLNYSELTSQNIVQSCIQMPNTVRLTNNECIWSIENSGSLKTPLSRVGHFSVLDADNKFCYIGYGSTSDNTSYNDLWRFDIESREWLKIELKGDVRTPRNGAKAVMINDDTILVFGGYRNGRYYADLHSINIKTGNVETVPTNNEPSARSTPVFEYYNQKLVVWGGYNGQFPSELNILDMKTMNWKSIPTKIKGRTGIPHVLYDGSIICYGNSNFDGFLNIDIEKETISYVQATGTPPPPKQLGASNVKVGKYILYYGGKDRSRTTFIYVLDPIRQKWFILHVLPNGVTTTFDKGTILDNGMFMIPKRYGVTMCYSKKTKELLFIQGSNNEEEEIWVFNLEEALAALNHREDLIDMLNFQL